MRWSSRLPRRNEMTLLLGVCLASFTASAEGQDPRSLDSLIAKLKTRDTLFLESDSVHIKCAWGPTDHLLLDDAGEQKLFDLMKANQLREIPTTFPQQTIMRTPGYQFELAKRGNRLFQKVINPLDLKYGSLGMIGAYDGSIGLELQERSHATIDQQPPPAAWQNWEYAFLLHFDVHRFITGFDPQTQLPPALRPVSLPKDLVDSPEMYTIAEDQALEGVLCHVVDKSDVLRFWFDPAKGHALRRVEKFKAGMSRQKGALVSVVDMADDREVRPGLWMPWKIHEELYFTPDFTSGELLGQPALRRTLTVESMEFDALSDEFFQVPIPANAIVHDNIRNIQYRNQTDGVPFSKAIDYANSHLNEKARPRLSLIMLIIGNVCVIAILLAVFFRRRDRSGLKS